MSVGPRAPRWRCWTNARAAPSPGGSGSGIVPPRRAAHRRRGAALYRCSSSTPPLNAAFLAALVTGASSACGAQTRAPSQRRIAWCHAARACLRYLRGCLRYAHPRVPPPRLTHLSCALRYLSVRRMFCISALCASRWNAGYRTCAETTRKRTLRHLPPHFHACSRLYCVRNRRPAVRSCCLFAVET